jgi:hypothetical protein
MTTPAHRTDTLDCLKDDRTPDAPLTPQQIVDMLPLLLTPGLIPHCAAHLGDAAAEKIMAYRTVLWSEMATQQRLATTVAEHAYPRAVAI